MLRRSLLQKLFFIVVSMLMLISCTSPSVTTTPQWTPGARPTAIKFPSITPAPTATLAPNDWIGVDPGPKVAINEVQWLSILNETAYPVAIQPDHFSQMMKVALVDKPVTIRFTDDRLVVWFNKSTNQWEKSYPGAHPAEEMMDVAAFTDPEVEGPDQYDCSKSILGYTIQVSRQAIVNRSELRQQVADLFVVVAHEFYHVRRHQLEGNCFPRSDADENSADGFGTAALYRALGKTYQEYVNFINDPVKNESGFIGVQEEIYNQLPGPVSASTPLSWYLYGWNVNVTK